MTRVSLHQQAMATSSGAFRGFTIQGKWYSHLLDPRSGQPAEGIKSVSVLASSAAEADVLATIASVLTVQQSLALIDATSDAACLILDRNDQVHCSSRWPASSSLKYVQKDSAPQDWNGGMELKVDFQIHQEGSSGRYRRLMSPCGSKTKTTSPCEHWSFGHKHRGPAHVGFPTSNDGTKAIAFASLPMTRT